MAPVCRVFLSVCLAVYVSPLQIKLLWLTLQLFLRSHLLLPCVGHIPALLVFNLRKWTCSRPQDGNKIKSHFSPKPLNASHQVEENSRLFKKLIGRFLIVLFLYFHCLFVFFLETGFLCIILAVLELVQAGVKLRDSPLPPECWDQYCLSLLLCSRSKWHTKFIHMWLFISSVVTFLTSLFRTLGNSYGYLVHWIFIWIFSVPFLYT